MGPTGTVDIAQALAVAMSYGAVIDAPGVNRQRETLS